MAKLAVTCYRDGYGAHIDSPVHLSMVHIPMGGFISGDFLDFFILTNKFIGSVSVVRNFEGALFPINDWVDFSEPEVSQDDILISTVDDVEKDLVYNSLDSNKEGGDELDDS